MTLSSSGTTTAVDYLVTLLSNVQKFVFRLVYFCSVQHSSAKGIFNSLLPPPRARERDGVKIKENRPAVAMNAEPYAP